MGVAINGKLPGLQLAGSDGNVEFRLFMTGLIAQLVERSLCMREVWVSNTHESMIFWIFCNIDKKLARSDTLNKLRQCRLGGIPEGKLIVSFHTRISCYFPQIGEVISGGRATQEEAPRLRIVGSCTQTSGISSGDKLVYHTLDSADVPHSPFHL